MIKKTKNNNILKYRAVRQLIKQKKMKINQESLDELNKSIFSLVSDIVENLDYNLKISGKKSIKTNDIIKAFDQLKKDEKYREI